MEARFGECSGLQGVSSCILCHFVSVVLVTWGRGLSCNKLYLGVFNHFDYSMHRLFIVFCHCYEVTSVVSDAPARIGLHRTAMGDTCTETLLALLQLHIYSRTMSCKFSHLHPLIWLRVHKYCKKSVFTKIIQFPLFLILTLIRLDWDEQAWYF